MRALVLVVLGIASAVAHAQAWPSKPIRIIMPNAPGGSPDIIGRIMCDMLGRGIGQQCLIDNRPGGEGFIGAEAAAKSPADGYTYFWESQVTASINPHLFKSMPYDSRRDFTPVGMVIDTAPFVMALNADVPAQTLPELIALAKSQPGKISFSTTVNISSMLGAWLNKNAGIQMVEVPYKAGTQAIQDALAGRIQLMMISLPPIVPYVKTGKIKLLAVTSAKRLASWPSMPTIGETFPGFEMEGWTAISAPTGTPAPIVQRLNRELDRVVTDTEFRKRLELYAWGNLNGASTPQAMLQFMRDNREWWGALIREVGIQPK